MITRDADATSADVTATPLTWNHTVASGVDTLLMVGVGYSATAARPLLLSATFAGINLNTLLTNAQSGLTDLVGVSILYLKNPPSGTNAFSIAFSGGTNPHYVGISTSYIYTSTAVTSVGNQGGGGGGTSGGTSNDSVIVATANSWLFGVGINTATTSPTLTAGSSQRGSQTIGSTQPGIVVTQDSNAAQPVGSRTLSWTIGGTGVNAWCTCDVVIEPGGYAGVSFGDSQPYISIQGNGMSRSERAT